jgi:hypothetical protein
VVVVLEEVAVVATKNKSRGKRQKGRSYQQDMFRSLVASALILPLAQAAHADAPPERASIAFKYLDYQDSQPEAKRISVKAPAFALQLPIAEEWSLDTSVVTDTVSGASPRYHSERSSITRMHDERKATEVKLTRYFSQGSVTFGHAFSRESDYVSRVHSLNGSISTPEKNTTLHLGVAATSDRINPSNQIVENETKQVYDLLLGVTQVLSTTDIAQANMTFGNGRGYYSDPYKFFDNRPRSKRTNAFLVRWNHHFAATDGTSRVSYRYYRDTFGIRSHTVTGEYVQPLADGWVLTPQARIYSQSAANFFLGPMNAPDPSIPDNFEPGVTLLSEDQRLAAFGGRSLGFKVAKRFSDVLVDMKYEHYLQRSEWAFNATGTPGIAPFKARILQFGLTYFF